MKRSNKLKIVTHKDGTRFLVTTRQGVRYSTEIDPNSYRSPLVTAYRLIKRDIRSSRRRYWEQKGVRTEPGWFLREQIRRGEAVIMDKKKPKAKARYVGVEIEFLTKERAKDVRKAFIQAGLAPYVNLTTDGSVTADSDDGFDCDGSCREECVCYSCGANGCEEEDCDEDHGDCYCECDCSDRIHGLELRVLAKQTEIGAIIQRVCKVLNNDVKAKINDTCGLHVHLDMRHRDHNKAFHNLVRAQPVLYTMVPINRLQCNYCTPTQDTSFDSVRELEDRYLGVNPHSYQRHRTLEVRLHSGTTNAVKINYWIELLIKIATARPFPNRIKTVKTLAKRAKCGAMLVRYMNERVNKFKSQHVNTNVDEQIAA